MVHRVWRGRRTRHKREADLRVNGIVHFGAAVAATQEVDHDQVMPMGLQCLIAEPASAIQGNGPPFVVETSTDLVEADDICTQLGQCHAAERCCHEGRAFDDAETFQYSFHNIYFHNSGECCSTTGKLDHALVAQFINLTVVYAKQILEHLYRVLSELGAQVPDLTRCFRQSGNHGRYNDRLSCFLFIHGDEIAAGVELTVAENVGDIVQRPGWCSSRIATLKYLLASQGPTPVSDNLVHVVAVFQPRLLLTVGA